MIFDNLTKEQKDSMKASLGVLIMTMLIGFWVPFTYLLLESGLAIIYVSFIVMAYSAVVTYMTKFATTILGTNKEDIPTPPQQQ